MLNLFIIIKLNTEFLMKILVFILPERIHYEPVKLN